MNKIIVIMIVLLLLPFKLFAGICNNASVVGSYSFRLTSIGGSTGQNPSIIDAGRMAFNGVGGNGVGGMTVTGIEYQGSTTKYISTNPNVPGSVTGTYSVSAGCVMAVSFKIPSTSPLTAAKTFSVTVYLDRIDTAPATNTAYHGTVIFKTSNSLSGDGEFDRVVGKF